MTRYFTADTHFGDQLSFRTCTDDEVIDRINETVGRDDILIHAGDFGNGTKGCLATGVKMRGIGHYRQRIRCRQIHLVLGNHDKPGVCRLHFSTVRENLILKSGDTKIHVNHRPYAYWDGSHRGELHVYGHVHSRREETLDGIWPERRSMDIGIDNALKVVGSYRPFSEQEIVYRLMQRAGHDPVEFYR